MSHHVTPYAAMETPELQATVDRLTFAVRDGRAANLVDVSDWLLEARLELSVRNGTPEEIDYTCPKCDGTGAVEVNLPSGPHARGSIACPLCWQREHYA